MLDSLTPVLRPWRATLVVTVFAVAIINAGLVGWWYAGVSAPISGPIVLISIDSLNPSRFSSGERASESTSVIHALAADAVIFERAYTHSPLTLPSHVSILAGQLPFEHGVRDEAGFALHENADSLAELLRNRGFDTGAAVSSFLLRPATGVAQGFTFFDAELPTDPSTSSPVVEREGADTAFAAAQWIRSRSGERFFLFVQVSENAAESTVAQLVSTLKELKLYEQATIILTSGHGDAGPGRPLDDASLRVPLLVKQPDGEGAGNHLALPVQHIDILPTLLDLVRAPVPPGLRGRSLRAALGGDDSSVADQPIYAESLAGRFRFGGPGKFALANDAYRYIRNGNDEVVEAEGEQITSPLSEGVNTTQLREELDRLLDGQPVGQPTEIAAADEDHYATLGYLGGARIADAGSPSIDPSEEAFVAETHRAAAQLVGQKSYTVAIDLLRAIAHAHPKMAVSQYQLGMLLSRAGRLEEAVAALSEAASAEPDNPYISTALARVLMKARRYDEAGNHARLAVALAELHDARARYTAFEVAARVSLALDDRERAEAYGEAAAREHPGIPMARFVRGRLLHADGMYEEALVEFQEAATVLTQHGRALEELHWYLGDTLGRLDRHPEAEAKFREELEVFPRSIPAYASLVTLYHASNRASGVEAAIDALVDTAPTPEGYDAAARLWTIVGEPTRAAALRADARMRFNGDPSLPLFQP